jgi:hypothetical protein
MSHQSDVQNPKCENSALLWSLKSEATTNAPAASVFQKMPRMIAGNLVATVTK